MPIVFISNSLLEVYSANFVRTKQFFFGLIIVNLVGIVGLTAFRAWQSDAQPTPLEPTPVESASTNELANRPAQVLSAASAYEIPPRPALVTKLSSEGERAEIADLRSQAFDVAEQTVTRLRKNPEALCLLATLHLRAGNADGAQQMWEQALEWDPNCVEAYVDSGNLLVKTGEFEQAEKLYRRALTCDANDSNTLEALAKVLIEQRKFDDATQQLDKLVALRPDSVDTWRDLGKAHQALRQFDEAADAYERALQLSPQSREATSGLMSVYRASGEKEKLQAITQSFMALQAADPRSAQDRSSEDLDKLKMTELLTYAYQRSSELLARSGDFKTAVLQLEKSRTSLRNSPALTAQLASFYVALQQHDRAIEVMQQLSSERPNDLDALMDLAVVCIQGRKLAAAEDALQRFLAINPKNAKAYGLLAQTQMPANRDPLAAVASARKAVELDSSAANHYILGTALYHTSQRGEALLEFRKAVELEPSSAEFRAALQQLQ